MAQLKVCVSRRKLQLQHQTVEFVHDQRDGQLLANAVLDDLLGVDHDLEMYG